ncbi:hypothetical protein DYB36_006138, partial [Aphanomyces astaci]
MNVPSPDTAKKKRQFGIRRGLAEHTEHKPTNVNRRDTGFGRPSKASSAAASAPIRKKPRSMGNHSWAHNDPVPSFAVSAISTSSTRYSTSNQFIKQPPSHHRQNIPSSKIIPGHALMRTEATRQTTAALPPATTTRAATGASYSKPHKNLMTVSRPVQPGILEAYSGGKSWTPHHAMSLTPPGKKPPAKSIPSTSRRRSLTPAAASTPDNDMCDTRHPLRQKRVPSGPPRVTDDMFYKDAPFQPTFSRRIIPACDTEYAKYNNMLLETTNTKKAHRVASPIVLVYPLPPHVTDVISITQNDLDRLQPAEYLNDNLVDYYF